MSQKELDLGQMLRDADIVSVEDIEHALAEAHPNDPSIGELMRQQATWASVKKLLTKELLPRNKPHGGHDLRLVLEQAGWVSPEQLARVLEGIDEYGDELGERLVSAGVLSQSQLASARQGQAQTGKPLWRVIVSSGFADVKRISQSLRIEDQLLGQALVDRELMTGGELQRYLVRSYQEKQPLSRLLVADGHVEADVIALTWSELYGLPFREIRDVTPRRELFTHFKAHELTDYLLLPLQKEGETLTVAVGDPTRLSASQLGGLDDGTRLYLVFAPIDQILERISSVHASPLAEDGSTVSLKSIVNIDQDVLPADLLDAILREASQNRGTDLHFDPGREQFYVRSRIDGILHDLATVSPSTGAQLVARLKALASLDTADTRRPNDGHLVARVGPVMADMRIATMPTRFGEKVVLRLVSELELATDFTGLGMSLEQAERLNGLLTRDHGMFLCAGPVGSGKTTTLYCALNKLNVPEQNLITLEDPIEYLLTRVNQVEISERQGVTYVDALRALLRQDPDVLMVGEIRDPESAQVAVRASMSGVLVLSTLHANDAIGSVASLATMGISPFLIASSLAGACSQRLARKLCPACSEGYTPSRALLDAMGFPDEKPSELTFRRGRGCYECLGTGYRGMVGLFEVLHMTDSLRDLILQGAGREELRAEAIRSGMQTLDAHAFAAIKQGQTTPEEFLKHVV